MTYQQDAEANLKNMATVIMDINNQNLTVQQAQTAYTGQLAVAQVTTVQALLALNDTLQAIHTTLKDNR